MQNVGQVQGINGEGWKMSFEEGMASDDTKTKDVFVPEGKKD
jgi:hypothetical protein